MSVLPRILRLSAAAVVLAVLGAALWTTGDPLPWQSVERLGWVAGPLAILSTAAGVAYPALRPAPEVGDRARRHRVRPWPSSRPWPT